MFEYSRLLIRHELFKRKITIIHLLKTSLNPYSINKIYFKINLKIYLVNIKTKYLLNIVKISHHNHNHIITKTRTKN